MIIKFPEDLPDDGAPREGAARTEADVDSLDRAIAIGHRLATVAGDAVGRELEQALLDDVDAGLLAAFDAAARAPKAADRRRAFLDIAVSAACAFLSPGGDFEPFMETLEDLEDDEAIRLEREVSMLVRQPDAPGMRALVLWGHLQQRRWTGVACPDREGERLDAATHMLGVARRLVRQASRTWEPDRSVATRLEDVAFHLVPIFSGLMRDCQRPDSLLAALRSLDFEAQVANDGIAALRTKLLRSAASLFLQSAAPMPEWHTLPECMRWRFDCATRIDARATLTAQPPDVLRLLDGTDDGPDAVSAWQRSVLAGMAIRVTASSDAGIASQLLEVQLRRAGRWESECDIQIETLRSGVALMNAANAPVDRDVVGALRRRAAMAGKRFRDSAELRLQEIRVVRLTLPDEFDSLRRSVLWICQTVASFPHHVPLQHEAALGLHRLAKAAKPARQPKFIALAASMLSELCASHRDEVCLRVEAAKVWALLAITQSARGGAALAEIQRLIGRDTGCEPLQKSHAIARCAVVVARGHRAPEEILLHASELVRIAGRFSSHAVIQTQHARAWQAVAAAFRQVDGSRVEEAARRVARIARQFPGKECIQEASARSWYLLVEESIGVNFAEALKAARRVVPLARSHPGSAGAVRSCATAWRVVAQAACQRNDRDTHRQAVDIIRGLLDLPGVPDGIVSEVRVELAFSAWRRRPDDLAPRTAQGPRPLRLRHAET